LDNRADESNRLSLVLEFPMSPTDTLIQRPALAPQDPSGPPGGCLYCGSAELTTWCSGIRDRLGCVPGRWGFLSCDACGSAVLSPFPPSDRLADFYPPVYSFAPNLNRNSRLKKWWSQFEREAVYRPLYRGDAQCVLRHTGGGSATGRKLVDVGCGRGLRLLAFQRLGYEVYGTDFQPEVVDYVREQLGIPAVCATIDGLPAMLDAEFFDVVTAYYLLEHVLDVPTTLRVCYSLLKPGGWLAAAVPLIDSVQSRVFRARWCQVTEAPRHVSVPSQEGLLIAARRAGFSHARVVPDSARLSAATLALSLIPAGTTHGTYASGRWLCLASRFLGLATAAFAMPWCWVEGAVFRRPALGILFAQRPAFDESGARVAGLTEEVVING